MNIQPLHPNFQVPTRGTSKSGGFDIYMPEGGLIRPYEDKGHVVKLGFAAEVPEGHVAKIYPRSGTGVKHGLCLNNTVGIIDADYRGEWMASLRVQDGVPFTWEAGDRVLQFVIVPVSLPELSLVDSLEDTARGAGGWGSTGK